MPKDDLATRLFDQIGQVAIDNRVLKRKIRAMRTAAQQGLAFAGENGAVMWRNALDQILEVSK